MSSALHPYSAATRTAMPRNLVVVAIGAAACAAIALLSAHFLSSDSKVGIALAAVVVTSPAWIYLTIRRPFIFPFAVYAVLVPFSNMLAISSFGTLAKVVGGLAIGALLFYVVRTKRIVRPPMALYAWLAFLAFAFASILWAIDPEHSFSLIVILLENFLLFAVVAITPATTADLRVVLTAIVIGGVAAAAYGTEQLLQGNSAYQSRIGLQSFFTSSDVLGPDQFGTMLVLPGILALAGVVGARSLWIKAACLCAFGVLMTGIYGSATRGAMLGIVTAIAYLAWKSRYRIQVLVMTALAGGATLLIPNSLWARIIHDNTGSGRIYIWKIGLDAFLHRWAFGAGIANFPDAYNQLFLSHYEPMAIYWNRAPHNFILMFAVELGVVGLALLTWAVIAQFKAVSDIQPSHPLFNVRIALEAGLLGLLVASMFLDVIYWKYAWLTFIALVMTRNASLADPEHLAKPVRRRRSSWMRAA